MHFSARSLRTVIFVSFIFTTSLVAIPAVVTIINTLKETTFQAKYDHLKSLAQNRSTEIERLLTDWTEKLALISSRTQLRLSLRSHSEQKSEKLLAKMNRILADAKRSSKHLTHVSMINLRGTIVASTEGDKIGLDFSQRTEFREGKLKGKIHDILPSRQFSLISVTSPMRLNGKLIGIIWSEVTFAELNSIALNNTGLGKTGELLIAGNSVTMGPIMIAPTRMNNSVSFNSEFAITHKSLIQCIINECKYSSADRLKDYRNTSVLAISKAIPNVKWGVMAKMDLSEIDQPVTQANFKIFTILTLLAFPFILLSLWLSEKLTRGIQNAEDEISSLMKAAVDAILLIDKKGLIIGLNNAGEKLFRCSKDDVIGTPASKLAVFQSREKLQKILERLCSRRLSRSIKQLEMTGQTFEGIEIPLEVSISQPAAKSKVALFIIGRDISKRKEAETQIKSALRQQQELVESQKQFVSIASHEFRTPLSIISNAVQHIERCGAEIDETYLKSKTGKIRVAVSRMLLLMRSTLSLSQYENGKSSLEIESCDIGALISSICSYHQDLSKNHMISYELENMPDSIQADAAAIEQILNNLLDNAVKYSPDSHLINVNGRSNGQYIEISVQDYGLGIAVDDLPKLFERFFRSETPTGIDGTGIGLFLVKTIAEMHDGMIEVDSEPGVGSTFTLKLPISGPRYEKRTSA